MIVQRSDLIAQIEERLAGRLADRDLATWAFDRFYAIEQGEDQVADDDVDLISAALDDLMFADDESFALEEAELRRLIERLKRSL